MKTKEIKYIKPEIQLTKDGSQTLFLKDINETYHSTHGALQESRHVFINEGLNFCTSRGKRNLKIFEMGFGTGLNVFLSLVECIENPELSVEMHSIEKHLVDPELLLKMEYQFLDSLEAWKNEFMEIIQSPWNEICALRENFELKKISGDFFSTEFEANSYDLIFFDAFGARAQAEMWTTDAFRICADIIKPGGVLVTYASKGSARRALQEVGFNVEKIPGPPGKREMMRAVFK